MGAHDTAESLISTSSAMVRMIEGGIDLDQNVAIRQQNRLTLRFACCAVTFVLTCVAMSWYHILVVHIIVRTSISETTSLLGRVKLWWSNVQRGLLMLSMCPTRNHLLFCLMAPTCNYGLDFVPIERLGISEERMCYFALAFYHHYLRLPYLVLLSLARRFTGLEPVPYVQHEDSIGRHIENLEIALGPEAVGQPTSEAIVWPDEIWADVTLFEVEAVVIGRNREGTLFATPVSGVGSDSSDEDDDMDGEDDDEEEPPPPPPPPARRPNRSPARGRPAAAAAAATTGARRRANRNG